MHYDIHVIFHQLQLITVQSHKKMTAPCVMRRGSATTDDQFAYFAPYGCSSVYRYQWSTEKWEELPPSQYWNSGLVIIDCELTAVGGYRNNKLITLRQGQWVEHYPPMNTERSSPAVVSTPDGNYVVVIGGTVGDDWTTVVELLDVRNKRWYELTNLPQPLIRPSATMCVNQIHVIGRDGDGYSCYLQPILSSNKPIITQPMSNILTWTRLNQQPVRWSTAATLNGQLVIVGGEQGGSPVNSILQLIAGQWVKIGSMSSGRRACLVVTSSDKMMVVGGYLEDSVEEYIVVYD